MPKIWLRKAVQSIMTHVAADPAGCALFARAVDDADRAAFLDYIKNNRDINLDSRCQDTDIFSHLISALASNTATDPFGDAIPNSLITANAARIALQNAKKNIRKKFLQSIGFTAKGRAAMKRKFEAIPWIQVEQLPESYPPLNTWIYEDPGIGERWREHLESDPQPDPRNQRHPMMCVEPELIVHDVEVEQEGVFYDSSGEIIALACRNFCPEEGVLPAMDGIIAGEVESRKSARLEDPGSLVQIGYSAGARNAPAFHWARNLARKLPDQVVADKDYQSSSAFALLWNLCRDFLPDKIMEDFDAFLDQCNMVRMQSGQGAASEFIVGEGVGTHGEYTVRIGDAEFIFNDAEMAPPSGVFGQNYSSPTHIEHQPHKYAIAWTIRRDHPSNAGGHFYIGTFGICIQAAANSLVVWRPADVHGTSLQDLDPHDTNPAFLQRGLAIVTPNRLPGVWKKYWGAEYNNQQCLAILAEGEGVPVSG